MFSHIHNEEELPKVWQDFEKRFSRTEYQLNAAQRNAISLFIQKVAKNNLVALENPANTFRSIIRTFSDEQLNNLEVSFNINADYECYKEPLEWLMLERLLDKQKSLTQDQKRSINSIMERPKTSLLLIARIYSKSNELGFTSEQKKILCKHITLKHGPSFRNRRSPERATTTSPTRKRQRDTQAGVANALSPPHKQQASQQAQEITQAELTAADTLIMLYQSKSPDALPEEREQPSPDIARGIVARTRRML